MRIALLVAVMLVGVCSVGCFPQTISTKSYKMLKEFNESLDHSQLYLQTVLLERPVGDDFLKQDVWKATSSPFSHEQTTLQSRNGLRFGVLSGLIPGDFAAAIISEDGTLQPMHRSFQDGVPRVVPIQGPVDEVQFQLLKNLASTPSEMKLRLVECGFQITAFPQDRDRVKLVLVPQLQHGDKQPLLKPSADGSQFARVDQKLLESYDSLGGEVILGPGEFLLIGATAEPEGTLGSASFIQARGDKVRQRLLVIRAGRGRPLADPDTVLGVK